MTKQLFNFPSLETLSIAAADRLVSLANESIKARGVFRIALAGGSTPRHLYEIISSGTYRTQTDWSAWAVYFGDERIVPLTDNRSNYAMAEESLLTHVPISKGNIHPAPVSLGGGRSVAEEYECIIRDTTRSQSQVPQFDLILLGLGSDGHTASLFPGKPALQETQRLVVESTPGALPPPVDRVTFTLPLLNAARQIFFLATGRDKADAFRAAYEGVPLGDVEQVPAHLVHPDDGDVAWFVTKELAAEV